MNPGTSRVRLKTWVCAFEATNSVATAYYFYFLFFYTDRQFHFSQAQNLALAALHGLIYIFGARIGGNAAQKNYFRALRIGFGGMAICLAVGSVVTSLPWQLGVLSAWTFFLCFTWPSLEALACEGESGERLKHMVGIYNMVWAGGSALAYFFGGVWFEHLGLRSLFLLPAAIHLLQWALVPVLERLWSRVVRDPVIPSATPAVSPDLTETLATRKMFLHMSWLGNPMAYVAINAAVPLIPAIANRWQLTPTWAGILGSVWFFSRLAAFGILWRWHRWHYRFGYLLGAAAFMVCGFAGMLLAPNLGIFLIAQVGFGLAVGLLYFSSLYYSMESETKGQHGGVHESALGFGIFLGSGLGAVGQYFFSQFQHSSTYAVTALLVAGVFAIWAIHHRNQPHRLKRPKLSPLPAPEDFSSR